MREIEKYYITSSLPYVNAAPHLGHAIELLYVDAVARYQKLFGRDVYFLTGADEHGQKIMKTAKEKNMSPEDFAAENSALFQSLADEWNISNNDFIRTTEERHIHGAQVFWQKSLESGDIYKKKYSGYYCVGCEAFVTEKDLVDGKCPIHMKEPELIEEENYFFRLSKYQEPLLFWYEKNSDFVYPKNRYNEMLNILKNGLEDISISRQKEKLSWGIPVPGDADQVMYVWFDALSNYVTALGFGSDDISKFQKYWPADAQVIGKDINRFHSLIWAAMLLSAGLELPKRVAVHGFVTVDGQKMSKSLGNVINPRELTEKFPLDAVRYFLLREIIFEADGDYSEEKFIERYNADLANGLGNLVNRILTMVVKYCDSSVPQVKNINHDLLNFVAETNKNFNTQMSEWRFDRALEEIWKLVTYSDQMISDKKPWEMTKEGKTEELNDLLYHLVEVLRHISINIWPFMPETSEKIIALLNLKVEEELVKPLSELQQWTGLVVGEKILAPEPLFPRLEK